VLADFAITKPTVGGSSGTWGTELNAALDVLVAHPGIKVVADADAKAAYAPLLGQVILQADTGKLYKCTNATGPVWAEVDAMTGVMTTEGDIIYQGASAPARLAKGTAGQRLQMNAGATAPEWVSPELTTKGDLLVYGSALSRLGVGSNGQVLTADSAQALGVKWATPTAGGTVPACRVYHNAAQSIAKDTVTTLSFNTESLDTDTIHDNSTNNNRLTCKTAGLYQINATIGFAAGTGGERTIVIRLNGTTSIGHFAQYSSNAVIANLSTIYNLSVNDYIEVVAYITGPATLNVTNDGVRYPVFSMVKVG